MTSDYANPVRLSPVHIAKPWGQEIWFTGMEARGESQVVNSDGQALPISRYLSRDPEQATRGQPLLLLKILDPLPTPVLGELYLEVHETKQEAYVVTEVNPACRRVHERFARNQSNPGRLRGLLIRVL